MCLGPKPPGSDQLHDFDYGRLDAGVEAGGKRRGQRRRIEMAAAQRSAVHGARDSVEVDHGTWSSR